MAKIIKSTARFLGARVRGTLNTSLTCYHQSSRFFRTYPRIKNLTLSTGFLIVAIIASRAAWNRWKQEKLIHDEHALEVVNRTEDDLAKFGVSFADIGPGKMAVELKVPGEIKLNGDMLAHMIPRFPGVAKQILKNLGDTVKKGDILATFENNANMATFEMRSQLDGVIIEKNVALGEVIGSSDEAFIVADLSQVWVDLYIYPTDLLKVKAGQKVRILDHTADNKAEGTLAYVAPTVSDHTRTALARVILQNTDMKWRPGTFITGAILVDETDAAILVDKAAITEIGGQTTIFVKKDDHFLATPVRVGRSDDHNFEILDGVNAGTRVATSGSFLLKSEIAKSDMAEHEH